MTYIWFRRKFIVHSWDNWHLSDLVLLFGLWGRERTLVAFHLRIKCLATSLAEDPNTQTPMSCHGMRGTDPRSTVSEDKTQTYQCHHLGTTKKQPDSKTFLLSSKMKARLPRHRYQVPNGCKIYDNLRESVFILLVTRFRETFADWIPVLFTPELYNVTLS